MPRYYIELLCEYRERTDPKREKHQKSEAVSVDAASEKDALKRAPDAGRIHFASFYPQLEFISAKVDKKAPVRVESEKDRDERLRYADSQARNRAARNWVNRN